MQKILIIIGIAIVIIGIFWPYLIKIPLGKLPGDIIINKPELKVYIPLTSMIIVSVIISVIMWLLGK